MSRDRTYEGRPRAVPRGRNRWAKWTVEDQTQYKAMMQTSGLKTAVYDPESDGGEFLGWFGARPSQIQKAKGIKAVKVIRPGLNEDDLKTVSEEDLEKMTKEFEEECAKGDNFITPELLRELGRKYCFTSGKCYYHYIYVTYVV